MAGRRRKPAVMAWLRLIRVFQKVDHATAIGLQRFGISRAHFDVLAHVGADEGITQQRLADSLLVTKGNVCQLLDRMEQRGLIERHQDGRANRLYLTPAGRRLFEQIVPNHEALVAEQFASLSSEEQFELLDLLRAVDRSLEYRADCTHRADTDRPLE